jgi:hypothetical protein
LAEANEAKYLANLPEKQAYLFNVERTCTNMTYDTDGNGGNKVQGKANNLEAQPQKLDPKLQYPQPTQWSTPQIKLLNI